MTTDSHSFPLVKAQKERCIPQPGQSYPKYDLKRQSNKTKLHVRHICYGISETKD